MKVTGKVFGVNCLSQFVERWMDDIWLPGNEDHIHCREEGRERTTERRGESEGSGNWTGLFSPIFFVTVLQFSTGLIPIINNFLLPKANTIPYQYHKQNKKQFWVCKLKPLIKMKQIIINNLENRPVISQSTGWLFGSYILARPKFRFLHFSC